LDAVAIVAVASAGFIAAVRVDRGGLAVLFAAVALLEVVRGGTRSRRRRSFTLRPDLARWLEDVAATTGEPREEVLDRSVSAYRASMRTAPDA
jgi:hypothetical protein